LTEISVVARIVRQARPPGHDGPIGHQRKKVLVPRGDAGHGAKAWWLLATVDAPGHNPALRCQPHPLRADRDGLETGARLDQGDVVHAPRRDHAGLPGSRLRLAGQQRGTDECQ